MDRSAAMISPAPASGAVSARPTCPATPVIKMRILGLIAGKAVFDLREQRRFGVNVLASGQADLARLFASKAPEAEKFADVQHTVHDGIPVIEGTLAWVGCTLEQLIPGGDHTIGIGSVTAAEIAAEGPPLMWYRGEYR